MSDKHTAAQGELLPCPMCGSNFIAVRAGGLGPGCVDCGTRAESKDAWNRRASEGQAQTSAAIPCEPTEAMQNGARDWSVKKYGIGIGKDAAIGCWQAMYDAQLADSTAPGAPVFPPTDGWPDEIYLNTGEGPLRNFDEYADVDWCDHPQGENDVRYIRAELCDTGIAIATTINRNLGQRLADALAAPGAPARNRGEWNSAINEIADELEERSNLSIISQFTALCIEFDRLRDAAPAAQQSPEMKARYEKYVDWCKRSDYDALPWAEFVKSRQDPRRRHYAPMTYWAAQQSLTAGGAVPNDLEIRKQVQEALGLGRDEHASFAWSYLLGCIKAAAAPLPQVQSEDAVALAKRLSAAGITNFKFTLSETTTATPAQLAAALNNVLDLLELGADQQPVTPSGALADNDGGVA